MAEPIDINAAYQKLFVERGSPEWNEAFEEACDVLQDIERELIELGWTARNPEALTDEFAHRVRYLARTWLKLQPAIVTLLPGDDAALKAFLFPEELTGNNSKAE